MSNSGLNSLMIVKEKKMKAMEMMPKIKETQNDASIRNGSRHVLCHRLKGTCDDVETSLKCAND